MIGEDFELRSFYALSLDDYRDYRAGTTGTTGITGHKQGRASAEPEPAEQQERDLAGDITDSTGE